MIFNFKMKDLTYQTSDYIEVAHNNDLKLALDLF